MKIDNDLRIIIYLKFMKNLKTRDELIVLRKVLNEEILKTFNEETFTIDEKHRILREIKNRYRSLKSENY